MSKVTKNVKPSAIVNPIVMKTTGLNNTTTLSATQPASNITISLPARTATLRSEANNTIRVEKGGNDAYGVRGGAPFLTITAAMAASLSGDIIIVSPGTYTEATWPIIMVDGVCLCGIDAQNCIISALNVTTSTTLLQMGNNNRVNELTFAVTSAAANITLTGIIFGGITATTSVFDNNIVRATNTVAGIVTIYGIRSNGTGQPASTTNVINQVTVTTTAAAATGGVVRALYIDGANTITANGANFYAVGSVATSRIALETNNAAAVCNLYASRLQGQTADYAQTLGSITSVSTASTTNGAVFLSANNQIVMATGTNSTTLNAAPTASRTVTIPDVTDTLVGKSTVDVLTNKTLTSTTNTIRATQLATIGSDVVISAAAAPTANQFLVATSAVAATWQTFSSTAASIQFAIIKDQKVAGTNGGSTGSGSVWTTRNLNTLTITNGTWCTNVSNQFTLSAGTYHVWAGAPAGNVGSHQTRIQNITDSTTTISGGSSFSTNNPTTWSHCIGIITLVANKTFELQHIVSNQQNSTSGFGTAGGFGVETYSQITITKLN